MDSLLPTPMPDKRPAPPLAAGRSIPEELSASEVLDRAVARFGWQAVLQALNYVALSHAKDRLADAVRDLAEGEEVQ